MGQHEAQQHLHLKGSKKKKEREQRIENLFEEGMTASLTSEEKRHMSAGITESQTR